MWHTKYYCDFFLVSYSFDIEQQGLRVKSKPWNSMTIIETMHQGSDLRTWCSMLKSNKCANTIYLISKTLGYSLHLGVGKTKLGAQLSVRRWKTQTTFSKYKNLNNQHSYHKIPNIRTMAHLSIWQQKYKTLWAVAFENYDESILVTIVRVILKKNHNGGFASKTERKSKTKQTQVKGR